MIRAVEDITINNPATAGSMCKKSLCLVIGLLVMISLSGIDVAESATVLIRPYEGEDIEYPSIQAAFDDAINHDSIMLQNHTFHEDLNFDREETSVLIQGGCDESFVPIDGAFSTIAGSLTVSKGTLEVENLTFSSSLITGYTVGGKISGLAGSIILQNNKGEDLTRTTNGEFTFTSAFENGASYSVEIVNPPSGQSCEITGGSGTISGSSISSILVWCHASSGGIPINGYPSWQERALQVVTNAVRQAPQEYLAAYTPFTGILLPANYPAVAPLYWNELLNHAAGYHALDMATTPCFQHNSCDGTSWITRISSFYPTALISGENIAWGPASPKSTVDLWICEHGNPAFCAADKINDGHRAMIMNSEAMEIGNGYNSTYWVQDFTRNTPALAPPLVSAAHITINGSLQFWLNYYGTGAPEEIRLVIDGSPSDMELAAGFEASGLYTTTIPATTGCQSYYFEAIDSQGKGWRYPGHGALRTFGIGGCADDYL
jgi:hypothetical protein